MTELSFTVASASMGSFPAQAEIAGNMVEVSVPGLVVELVSADGSMSQTLRITPVTDETRDLFTIGETVTATYAAAI